MESYKLIKSLFRRALHEGVDVTEITSSMQKDLQGEGWEAREGHKVVAVSKGEFLCIKSRALGSWVAGQLQ